MFAIAPMERWRTATPQVSESTRHCILVRRLKTRHRLEVRKRLGVWIQSILGHIRQNLLGDTERDRCGCPRGCQVCGLRLRRNAHRTAVVYPNRGNPHGALVVLDAEFAHAQIQAISREPRAGPDNEIDAGLASYRTNGAEKMRGTSLFPVFCSPVLGAVRGFNEQGFHLPEV